MIILWPEDMEQEILEPKIILLHQMKYINHWMEVAMVTSYFLLLSISSMSTYEGDKNTEK